MCNNISNWYCYYERSRVENDRSIITRFVKRKLFGSECINENEIKSIPPMYRLRIFITQSHINRYVERIATNDKYEIEAHRRRYLLKQPKEKPVALFRYCFDLRKIFDERNSKFDLFGEMYYFQPDDHRLMCKLWERVNGRTDESIRFLQNMEYYKTLSKDLVLDRQLMRENYNKRKVVSCVIEVGEDEYIQDPDEDDLYDDDDNLLD